MRFVGRSAEIEQLRNALDRASQDHGQVVAVAPLASRFGGPIHLVARGSLRPDSVAVSVKPS
jgi:hypothetical protein